jgi:DNA-directed RNA polymerase beta subunit
MPPKFYPLSKSFYNFPGVFFAPDDPGNGQQTADDKDKTNANGSGNAGPTQEELNRQFAERAKRAEEAERKRLLEALGVQSEDDLKAIVQAKKEADEKAKTEQQKLADEAAKAKAEAAKLKADSDAQLAAMQKRLLDSEIKLLASKPVVNEKDGKVLRAAFRPEALEALLLVVDRGVITDKEGKYEGIDKALETAAKAHAYMLADTSSQTTTTRKGTPGAGGKPAKPAGRQEDDEESLTGLEFNGL